MKNLKVLVWRFFKMMIGSVICVAIIGFSSYYLSWGLNWLTDRVMSFLSASADYLRHNWIAVIVLVIAITIGSMIFEAIFCRMKKCLKNRKK